MRHVCSLLVALAMTACGGDRGPPLSVTDLRIYAPVPGSPAGVAYFRIENRGDRPITIERVVSPQFGRVEMHETTHEDGVARMQALDTVQVAANSGVEFEAGGKHLMLMERAVDAVAGSVVTLELQHEDGLLIVSATMQNRLPAQ